jgi:hypothetical protein
MLIRKPDTFNNCNVPKVNSLFTPVSAAHNTVHVLSTVVNKMATMSSLAQNVDTSAPGSDIGGASTILRIFMAFRIFPEKFHSSTLM